MPRIGVATIFHESNTFIDGTTPLEAFRILERETVLTLAGTQTVAGGFLRELAESRMTAVPVLWAWATPGPVLEPDALDALATRLCELMPADLDGLLLELHGAMCCKGRPAADAEIARVARRALGDKPIVAVIDPHANLEGPITAHVDALLAYRTNPHVDMGDCGARAVRVLERLLAGGERPAIATVRIPILAPAIAQGTSDRPLRSLVAAVAEIERDPAVLSASLCFGYCYGDVADAGMHAVVVADRDAVASEHAERIADAAWAARAEFERELLSVEEGVAQAREVSGLSVLVDAGDNVGGGASGSQTAVAAALHGARGLRSATTICDPQTVSTVSAHGDGAELELAIGTPPLELSARVVRLCEGRYVNRGPLSAGVPSEMGPTAVLKADDLTLVVQSRAVMANDQNIFTSVGVELDALDAVALKGAVAVRAGWEDRASSFLEIDSPGATPCRLEKLRYRRVERPVWPLDPGDRRC